jgi:hypothetical protein
MNSIHRRLAKLESRRPVAAPTGRMIAFDDLDPAIAAMFLSVDCDVNRMSLAQLVQWEAEINRFAD